jgi:hypothetical protein
MVACVVVCHTSSISKMAKINEKMVVGIYMETYVVWYDTMDIDMTLGSMSLMLFQYFPIDVTGIGILN